MLSIHKADGSISQIGKDTRKNVLSADLERSRRKVSARDQNRFLHGLSKKERGKLKKRLKKHNKRCNRFHKHNNHFWDHHISHGQQALIDLLAKIYQGRTMYINYKGFSWLKCSTGRYQEFDIFFPDLKLAFEYDGEQHFFPVADFGGASGLKKTQILDNRKNDLVKQHPEDVYKLIRFAYNEPMSEDYVFNKIINS